MHRLKAIGLVVAVAVVALGVAMAISGDKAQLPETATQGPDPTLPRAQNPLIPAVKIVDAEGCQGSLKRC